MNHSTVTLRYHIHIQNYIEIAAFSTHLVKFICSQCCIDYFPQRI